MATNHLRVDVDTSVHDGLPHDFSLPSFGLLTDVSTKGDGSVGFGLCSDCSTNQVDAHACDDSIDGQDADKDPT